MIAEAVVPRRNVRTGMLLLAATAMTAGSFTLFQHWLQPSPEQARKTNNHGLTKEKLAEFLGNSAAFYRFPTEIELPAGVNKIKAVVQYSFDQGLQSEMEGLFDAYQPDYGAFVAVDATTGRVLSMISYQKDEKGPLKDENLALRATFPSASVFKVVTAAAAIESQRYSAQTVIPFNGANHTLYRGNVLKGQVTRWTRHSTLKEAFAKSINTVFAKIGAFAVGPTDLRAYAGRFGFNRKIAADFPIQQGKANIPDDSWGVAEAASGYTRENTMSPLQGALIASSVANDGVMMEPYLIDSIFDRDGASLYQADTEVAGRTIDAKTAEEIRGLMRETVARGTSRHSFRGFFRKEYKDLDVGGKTGSLTGLDPKGKYDWFVGYANSPEKGGRKIAFAALTIHDKFWRVKSSYLVRKAIEHVFKTPKQK